MKMSVSNVTGKLSLAMMLALGLGLAAGAGGCVVADGTGDETQGEKTEQAVSDTDQAAATSSNSTPSTTSGAHQSAPPGPNDPEPLPWLKGSSVVRGGVAIPNHEGPTNPK
jgi:hypothetical protein